MAVAERVEHAAGPAPSPRDAGPSRHRWLERSRLPAIAVGVVVAEMLVLWALAQRDALALAPQVSAPEPFAIFHDLRWLLVYHPNRVAFAVEAAGFVAFRSFLDAILVREAWPGVVDPPGLLTTWRRTAWFTFVGAAAFSPWAALLFGMGVVSLSWLFFVAVPATLVLALFVHLGPVTWGWWRKLPGWRTVGWVAATFAALSVFGALLVEGPWIARLPVAVAAGLFNAWVWQGLARNAVSRPSRLRAIPIVPLAIAGMVLVAAVGTAIGVRVGRPSSPPHRAAPTNPFGRPILVVQGFGSRWAGNQNPHFGAEGFREERFSYAGIGRDGRPLPYEPEDTFQKLETLSNHMAAQVAAFSHATHRPVAIVAESEGAMVAKTYLLSHPGAPVDLLVMVSPLPRPGRVYYPPDGHDGWGVAGGVELRALAAAVRGLTPLEISPMNGLFRSMADQGPLLRTVLSCSVAPVEELAILPLADAVAGPWTPLVDVPSITVPAFHGGLLDDAPVRRAVVARLEGSLETGSRAWKWEARTVSALAAAWQVPELPVSLNHAWDNGHVAGDCHPG